MQGSGPFKAGDVVQFNCNPDYMMEGQPIIACQDNSRWSGKLPKCEPGIKVSPQLIPVCCRRLGVFLPRNHDQREDVFGQVLLQDRREHYVHVRRGVAAEGGGDAEMPQEWEVVKRDPDVLVREQSGRERLIYNKFLQIAD
jgi:hypothetical protein